MKLASTFITTVLFFSISIAAAIDPQVAACTTVIVAGGSPASPASGSSVAESSAAFDEEDFKHYVNSFRNYMDFITQLTFKRRDARPMAEDFRERLSKLQQRLGDGTISETLAEEMKFFQYKVDLVEEVADDLDTYVGFDKPDPRILYDLIRARIQVLFLQTSPEVYDLDILKQSPARYTYDEVQRYAFAAWKLFDGSIKRFEELEGVSQERKNAFYDTLYKTEDILEPLFDQFPDIENTKA